MWFILLFGFSILGYTYRKFILQKTIYFLLILIKYGITIYTFINKKKNGVTKRENHMIENYQFQEYNVIVDDKDHQAIILNTNAFGEDDQFGKNISEKISNKNLIVHCSITNESNDILIDLTETFRHFFYHYEDQNVKMDGFFKYINEKYKDRYSLIEAELNLSDKFNIYGYIFTIYMNDDFFTEYNYNIMEIVDKSFYEVLCLNEPCKFKGN